MPPKRTISKNKHNLQKKNEKQISRKILVVLCRNHKMFMFIHIKLKIKGKNKTNQKTTLQHSIPYHHVTVVPFQVPLPPDHPFNINRPQNQSGVSATIPINNTTTITPAINPTTPVVPQTQHATPHTTPFVTPRGKRGKKLNYSDNPESGETLPTIAEILGELDSYAIDTSKAMASKENVKAHIPSKIKKHKLVNLLKNHHMGKLKNI